MRTRFQLLHMLSGIIIAVLLGIHMVILHLGKFLSFFGIKAAEPTSWESMMNRSSKGIWTALYIALLAFALYHALYGLRGIVIESTHSPKIKRGVTLTIIAVGIIAFIWGIYVPVALFIG